MVGLGVRGGVGQLYDYAQSFPVLGNCNLERTVSVTDLIHKLAQIWNN